jgi:hypothetical protein
MLADPATMKAVRKEAAGLESKGTWDNATVKEVEATKIEAKKPDRKFILDL